MEKEKIEKTKNQGHIKWMMMLIKFIELIIDFVRKNKKSENQ